MGMITRVGGTALALSVALAACAEVNKDAQKATSTTDAKTVEGTKAGTDAATDKSKVSYVVGMDMARSLELLKGEVDPALLARTLESLLTGGEAPLSAEEAEQVRMSMMQRMQAKQAVERASLMETNRKAGEAFLTENKAKSGVKITDSGLQYQAISRGKGSKPKASDTVRVHYAGALIDGTPFDSSYVRGEPAQLAVSQVVPGFAEALQMMSPGSKYKFWLPSGLAYGEKGQGPIGPNAALTFEVELLEVLK